MPIDLVYYQKSNFIDFRTQVKALPGIYLIFTNNNEFLKVGIGKDILKRLKQHSKSKDKGLRLKQDNSVISSTVSVTPDQIKSKISVLAKHLYFDKQLTKDYDLQTECGRQNFLLNNCHIFYKHTVNRAEARMLEDAIERTENIRYVGRVVERTQ